VVEAGDGDAADVVVVQRSVRSKEQTKSYRQCGGDIFTSILQKEFCCGRPLPFHPF